MNRFAQKVVSGGLAAGLSVGVALSASAQQARSGAWTLNAPEGEWHMTGRDYSLQRFSPLKQITTSNVAELRPVWSFSTGTLRGHEGNPLVIGNVMYVHTSFPNIVYALDLSKPGAPQIWKYVPNQSPDAIPIACCDLVNRGTAYHPSGKIFSCPRTRARRRCLRRCKLLRAPMVACGSRVGCPRAQVRGRFPSAKNETDVEVQGRRLPPRKVQLGGIEAET
jgi:glucose dehydrogenase